MKSYSYWALLAAGALLAGAAGCGKHSSAQTQADVANAEAKGAKSVAAANDDAATRMANARRTVTNTELDLAHEGAEAARNVTIAKAEAAHHVALERCELDTGDMRKICVVRADTELAAAKAAADATRAANDPKA
jgi:hypothetical protein